MDDSFTDFLQHFSISLSYPILNFKEEKKIKNTHKRHIFEQLAVQSSSWKIFFKANSNIFL